MASKLPIRSHKLSLLVNRGEFVSLFGRVPHFVDR